MYHLVDVIVHPANTATDLITLQRIYCALELHLHGTATMDVSIDDATHDYHIVINSTFSAQDIASMVGHDAIEVDRCTDVNDRALMSVRYYTSFRLRPCIDAAGLPVIKYYP